MTKKEIKETLEQNGIVGVVSTRYIAKTLKISVYTILAAKNRGEISQIDRNTFDADSITTWLHEHQRYLVRLFEN